MNILIVDDNANNRMILKLLLEDYSQEHNIKFNIYEANDGLISVRRCKEKNISIIFMDIMMPNMDGIEATKIIKDLYPEIMIIAVSAVDDSERQKRMINSGAEDYISKPINSDIFVSRISNYITLVSARRHKRKNEKNINLFTKEIYNRNTKFSIYSEDSLSEFWEFFLLNARSKYDGLTDIVRAIFSIAERQVRLSVNCGIYIEESEDSQYFTLTDIDQLPSKIVELILKKNPVANNYMIEDSKISFQLDKICSVEDEVEEKITRIIEVNKESELVNTVEYKSKELTVFNYLDDDDLYDLEEYASKLNTLMMIVGSGDVTYEELAEIHTYLDKIGSILSTYSEVYSISKALSDLAKDLEQYSKEFIENSSVLGVVCKAFSNDMSAWIQMSFHTGAPSAEFMNDTIVVNCQTISSMLKMDDTEVGADNVDDIFDF